MNITDLSDAELLSHLHALTGQARVILTRLLATLGEVEERRLHLQAACSSLFDFCVQRLGMSEGEAFRRITVARLARRFPAILESIERGDLHLSSVVLLRDYLTVENHVELLAAASCKTKRKVQEMIAARFPRPDAPPRIRTLPKNAAAIEPLSAGRYKVQFTVSAELRRKIDRATNLMSHRNPSGDIAVLIERGLDLLIAQLEKERLGKSARRSRQSPQRTTRPGYVTKAIRREVFERDGEQCCFVDDEGRRCSSRAFLELDHVQPRALGGTGDADNLRVLCRAHNRRMAEHVFGREHVQKQIHLRRRKREVPIGTGGVEACGEEDAPSIETVLREGLALLVDRARSASRPDEPTTVATERSASAGGPSSSPPARPPVLPP